MDPVRLFLETVPLLTRPSGIANYVAGLLTEFARQPDAVRCFTGLASSKPARQAALEDVCRSLAPGVGFVRVPCPNRLAVAWPRLAGRLARPAVPTVAVAHATANAFASWLPPQARVRVLTIHDVVYLRHRGGTFCDPQFEARMAARLPADCRAADLILTDSEFSKAEICDLLRVPPEKVAVAYLSSSLEAAASQNAGTGAAADTVANGPFVLYVGTIEPRKNIGVLLDAFEGFRQSQPDARLVMVGRAGWRGQELVARLRALPGVDYREGCSAPNLARLYRQARGAFLVSRYEGFGLPVLEAMTLGCPVCYGTGSSMGEIAADAGIAVSPDDRDTIIDAMRTFWDDSVPRRELRERALVRAARFTPAATAAATLAGYRMALERAS